MKRLFRIEAEIKINKDGGRTWPIITGYRPGFKFRDKMQTSGAISLLDRKDLKPGESAIVEISFVSNMLLGNIEHGTQFAFYEGPAEIGQGKIIKVIGWR